MTKMSRLIFIHNIKIIKSGVAKFLSFTCLPFITAKFPHRIPPPAPKIERSVNSARERNKSAKNLSLCRLSPQTRRGRRDTAVFTTTR